MEQIVDRPKFESWREAERAMKRTRDLEMKVSLPKLKCLEELEDDGLRT